METYEVEVSGEWYEVDVPTGADVNAYMEEAHKQITAEAGQPQAEPATEETPMTETEQTAWETGEVPEKSMLDKAGEYVFGEEGTEDYEMKSTYEDLKARALEGVASAEAKVVDLAADIYDTMTGYNKFEAVGMGKADISKPIEEMYSTENVGQIEADRAKAEEAKSNTGLRTFADVLREQDYGSDPAKRATYEDFKNASGIINKTMAAIDAGAGTTADSAGEIAVMIASLPVWVAGQVNENAKTRAKNRGSTTVDTSDYAIALPAALFEGYSERLGLGKLVSAKDMKSFGSAVGLEIGIENAQEMSNLLATNYGTKAGITQAQVEETVFGATTGAGVMAPVAAAPSTTVGMAQTRLERRNERRVARETEKATADAKVQEKLDNIKNVNAQNADILAQGTNRQAFIEQQMETGTIQTPAQAAELQRQADIEATAYESGQGVRAANLTPDVPPVASPVTMPTEEAPAFIEAPIAETVAEEAPVAPAFLEETTTAARTRQQAIDEAFQEGARSGGVGGTITPEADLAQEFRSEETTAKRDKEDVTQTVVSNKIKRKQARAQRVLDDPASSNEAVERAEELLIESDEDVAMAQVKRREQEVKRKKEDLVDVREGFLAGDKKVAGRKKNELIQIAESLGLDVQPTKGKKSVSVPQYREAIASHPDVVIAEVKPTADVADVAIKPIETLEEDLDTQAIEAETAKMDAITAKAEAQLKRVRVKKAAREQTKATFEAAKEDVVKDPFEGWTMEDGAVFDAEGGMVEGPRRTAYMKASKIEDVEALAPEDRGQTPLSKAKAKLRRLEENEGVTKEEIQRAAQKVADIEAKLDREAKAATKGETAKVEEETAEGMAPEGAEAGVVGQEEVKVDEATLDVDDADVITDEMEEAPAPATPEANLAASIKQMIQQEVSTITKEEMVDEGITDLTERQEDQLDGWSRAGVDENIIEMAEQNTELLTAVDVLTSQYKKEGMDGREAFLKAVDEVTGSERESVIPDVTPEEKARILREGEGSAQEGISLQSEEEARGILRERFGSDWGNLIEFRKGQHPSKRNVSATYYPDAKGTGKIVIWMDNVKSRDLAELMLHEKGIHQLLADTPGMKEEFQAVKDRMESLLEEGNEEVIKARDKATATYDRKWGEEAWFRDDREETIAEETIAYLMNDGKNRGWFRKVVAKVRKAFKDLFNVDLTPDELRMVVADMVTTDAASYEAAMADTGTTVDVDERPMTAEELAMFGMESVGEFNPNVDYRATTEEKVVMKEAVDNDVNSSENEWYQGTVANSPRSYFQRVWDVSQTEGTLAAIKAGTYHVTDKPLKAWIPQSHLLRQAKEVGLDAIAELETVADKARQEAQENIDYAIQNVVKPARSLAQTNRPEYLQVVQMLHNATYNNKDMKKSAEFGRLSEEAQNVYKEVEAHYKKQGQLMLESMAVALDTENLSDANKEELQKYINTFRHTLNNTVYFPMQRFGSRRITAANETLGRHVEFMDHTSEIIEAKKELMKMGYAEGDIKIGLVDNLQDDAKVAMDRNVFDKAQSIISNMEGNEKAQEALWRTFMAMAPSNKLKDRMSKRRFVKGASNRMAEGLNRSTSQFFETAQRRHSPERSEMLREAEAQLDAMPQVTPEEMRQHKKAEEILKEVKLREKMQGQVRAKWSSGLSKANFFIHLGFNMSSAIINLTQNVIVGVPVLAAKHPAGKVATEMSKQFVNATKILGGGKPFESGSPQSNALIDLQHRGAINLTQAQMLQDISESDRNMIKDGVGEKVMAASAFMFHKAEVANRITSAMTSFNLNYDGTNYQEAIEQAIKDTREIHFDYSEEGKSRIQRGDIGGVALAFKSYPIQMAWYMASNLKKSMWFTEGTHVEKKAARTKIVGTLLMTQLFAGAMGLPTSSVFHMIADMIMEDEDDAHEMFKEFLRDNLGEELGDAVRMGVIGQMTGVNLSSRTSLDQMFFRIPQGEAKAADWGKSLMEASVGPIGARISTIPKGVDLMLEGKALAGMEAFMPAIYTNVSRATRWGAEGQANNAYDDLVEKDFNAYDAILKGIGFSSSEYQDTSEDLWMGKRKDASISRQKRTALRDMAIAVIQGDGGDRSAARRAIRQWNRAHPDDKISQSTVKRRVKDLRKKLAGEE